MRVDVVVTDKKGNYIQDLTTKDFRLYEDDKEQAINTFSFGAAPNGPIEAQRHYIVVFFDNASMDLSDQPRARAAAAKFIDAYAGPDRVMAVMNFGGSLQIVQNFTTDAARLKQAVSGIANSNIATNASASNTSAPTSGLPQSSGFASLGGNAEGDFGAYTLLLSIRQLAKNLAAIPGRKSLILFTAGFELSAERYSELTATIDACNKANVAVYPMDVRGLVAPITQLRRAAAAARRTRLLLRLVRHRLARDCNSLRIIRVRVQRWCLRRSMAVAEAAEDMAAEAAVERAEVEEAARAGAAVMAGPVGRAARAGGTAGRAAVAARAREIRAEIITATRITTSRGKLFRNFRRLRRRTSK